MSAASVISTPLVSPADVVRLERSFCRLDERFAGSSERSRGELDALRPARRQALEDWHAAKAQLAAQRAAGIPDPISAVDRAGQLAALAADARAQVDVLEPDAAAALRELADLLGRAHRLAAELA